MMVPAEWSIVRAGGALTVSALGATVTSWKVRDSEMLFMSVNAKTSGPDPINGGIPVVFPHFGDWGEDRPLHGFASRSMWTLDEAHHKENPYQLRFTLEDTAATRALWNYPFRVVYDIVLLEDAGLKLTFEVENKSQHKLAFNQLFHPYFKVDVEHLKIAGFKGAQYINKASNFAIETETRDNVLIDRRTDSIYMNTDLVHIIDDGKKKIRAEKCSNLPDTVVWNPQEIRAVYGLAEGEEDHFICVEAGHVARPVELGPEQRWTSQLLLTVEERL